MTASKPAEDTAPAEDARLAIAEVKAARLQAELRDARNDLLDVRGFLSPNGDDNVTPVPLVPNVAPAVEWLVAEVERLRRIVKLVADLTRYTDGFPLDPDEAVLVGEVQRALRGESA